MRKRALIHSSGTVRIMASFAEPLNVKYIFWGQGNALSKMA